MKKYGLRCPIRRANPYRKMAKALDESNVAPNLLKREFKLHGARKVLLANITYLKRADGDFSYLCTILDAFTKQILSYALSFTLKEDFVLAAVKQLIEAHGLMLSTQTLIHSDQGGHYKASLILRIIEIHRGNTVKLIYLLLRKIILSYRNIALDNLTVRRILPCGQPHMPLLMIGSIHSTL